MNSKSVSGRLTGEDLEEFESLQHHENLTQSATLAMICREWRYFITKSGPPARYASVDPDKFNLALGCVVKLRRNIRNALTALRSPRPIDPEDEVPWRDSWRKANIALNSTDAVIRALNETAKLLTTPPIDPREAASFIIWSRTWSGETGARYQAILASALKPWTGSVPAQSPCQPPESHKH
jgi:hypothetical protein